MEEWKGSGISDETIALNYKSFDDEAEPISLLTYGLTRSDYLNNGRLKSKHLRGLKHLKNGAWACIGENVTTGEESVWSIVKPNTPREIASYEKGGIKKVDRLKYEAPRKSGDKEYAANFDLTGLTAVKVSFMQWQSLAERHNVPIPNDIVVQGLWARGFYQWVHEHVEIPIVLTEGAKKASVLIDDGRVCLGLAGVSMGFRSPKDEFDNKIGDRYLIPALKYFAQPGREFCIAFDNDKKQTTQKAVGANLAITGNLLEAEGCNVSVISWNEEEEKGLDDLILAHGFQRFDEAYNERKPFQQYKFEWYQANQERDYLGNKKYTPELEINQEYLDVDCSNDNAIYFVKSPLGSGKTHNLIENLLKEPDSGMIFAGYRNTLCLQFNERTKQLGFYHLQKEKHLEEFNLNRDDLKVSFCLDSLGYFDVSQFDGKIIILDEVVSVVKHLLFSSTIRNFEQVRQLFSEMLRRSDRVICLDGNLQDWTVKFISSQCPDKKVITIGNVFKGKRSHVTMLDGVIKDEKLQKNNRTPYVKEALESDRPFIVSDSQTFCESMEKQFIAQGRKGIRIDSTTTSLPEVQACLSDPKKYLEENELDYFIGSPSIESGFDVNVQGYFSALYAFAFGALDTDSVTQLVSRLRDHSIPWKIWAKESIYSADNQYKPSNADAIRKQRDLSLRDEIKELIDQKLLDDPEKLRQVAEILQKTDDPFVKAADTIQAIRNHEFKNYRLCIAKALTDMGHKVDFIRHENTIDLTSTSNMEKNVSDEVRMDQAEAIFNGSNKYVGKLHKGGLAYNAPKADKDAYEKAKLISALPGIEKDPAWSEDLIYKVRYQNPNLINQVNNAYLLHNPEIASKIAYAQFNRIHNNPLAPIWRMKRNLPYLKAIRETGIFALVHKLVENPGLFINLESPEVKEVIAKCQLPENEQYLGKVGKFPLRYLHKHIKNFACKLKSFKVREGEQTVRYYQLDEKFMSDEIRSAIIKSTQLKYVQRFNDETPPLKWEKLEVKFVENLASPEATPKIPETPTIHGGIAVAHEGVIVNNNSAMCHTFSDSTEAVKCEPKLTTSDVPQDSVDSEAGIIDLATILSGIEDREELAELARQGEAFSRSRLNRAVRRLSAEIQQRIRGWAYQNQVRLD